MHSFGTSGIRAVAESRLVQLALNVGLSVGTVYGNVVGCDTRTSSEALKHAFISGLLSAGSRSCDAGVVPMVTPYLLTKLGCSVVVLNCYPSGFFPHAIEATEANLGDLMRVIGELGAHLGIAHDGDADRVMVVDDRGRFVSGDKLLAIFAQGIGVKEVITTIDASMAIEEMGFDVTRTRVGDTYVSEEVKRGGDFGGEQEAGFSPISHSALLR